jgi:hypothetical protein
MNVTEEGLKEYIEVFYETLQESSQNFLPTEHHKNIRHLSFLPARIVGYVSTQYGTAIEYIPGDETFIEIVKGSSRVEDLLVQAPKMLQSIGPIFRILASNIGIFGLILADGFPFRLLTSEASLSIGNLTFKYKDWARDIFYAELYSNRLRENWNKEKAISRAKDEVLAALVEIKQAESKNISIFEYIAKFKEKTVLILGDYNSEGEKRLNIISDAIKHFGYEPLLVKDIPDNPYHDIAQKVVAIGAIARFVVVDDSSKSGHLSEIEICKQNNWITILLRAGRGGSLMTAGISHHSNVILEKDYDLSAPEVAISEIVSWAENKLKEVKEKFDFTYPWRNVGSSYQFS